MAAEKLKKFLKEMAQNPVTQQEYLRDPKKVMDAHGVAAEHQQMILGGNIDALGKVLGSTDTCPVLLIHNYKK